MSTERQAREQSRFNGSSEFIADFSHWWYDEIYLTELYLLQQSERDIVICWKNSMDEYFTRPILRRIIGKNQIGDRISERLLHDFSDSFE